MNRIVILGDGYQAGKAVRLAQRIHPRADIVWIAEYEQRKYSLAVLGMLLKSGVSPHEWSRVRARIKVGFEEYQKSINLMPQRVKKIRINHQESEISFLTGRGNISYSFDKTLVFPAKTIDYNLEIMDGWQLWPEDSCVQYIANNWGTIDEPAVVGEDLSLVQALVCGKKKFTWVRTGSIFSEQAQYFLDAQLAEIGVRVVTTSPGSSFETALDKIFIENNMKHTDNVFICGCITTDYARLKSYGLDKIHLKSDAPDSFSARNVVLIDDSVNQDRLCANPGHAGDSTCLSGMVKAALTDSKPACTDSRTQFWNMGRFSAAIHGMNFSQAQKMGHSCEFAVVHGNHGIIQDKPYLLSLIIDKPSRNLLGAEAVGEKAHEWVNLAACLQHGKTDVSGVSKIDLVWPDPVINPFVRCVRMLENKARPGILGITPAELKQSAEQGADFFLLDVRKESEFSRGRLPGASNIPLDQLKKRVMEIPRFTPLVLYSECSGRAYEAARLLRGMGAKQLYVLDGGYGLYNLEKDTAPLTQEDAPKGACTRVS